MTATSRIGNHARVALKVALPIAIVYAGALATERLTAARPEVARQAPTEDVVPVEVATTRLADNRPAIEAYGEVVPARVVDLRALVSGEVAEVHPDLAVGGVVAKGDLLVAVDDFPYRGALTEAEAALEEARARIAEIEARIALEDTAIARVEEQLAFAERDLDRAERLAESGNLTEQQLDQRRLVVSQRRQTLEQRRHTRAAEEARLKQQKAALERLRWQRDKAARDLRDTVLRAPFDGVVASETVEPGRLVGANDVVVRLYERDALEVRFVVSELAYGRLVTAEEPLVGRPVDVVWRIGDEPVTYEAVVERVSPEIEAERGGIGMLARLDLAGAPVAPRPGAFVEVEIPGVLYPDTMRLAGASVYGDTVYVVSGGRLERRSVRVLARDGEDVIVKGDLAPGETVLRSRLTEVGEGLRVKPTNEVPRIEPEATAEAPARERT